MACCPGNLVKDAASFGSGRYLASVRFASPPVVDAGTLLPRLRTPPPGPRLRVMSLRHTSLGHAVPGAGSVVASCKGLGNVLASLRRLRGSDSDLAVRPKARAG